MVSWQGMITSSRHAADLTFQVVPVASEGTAGYHAGLLLGMDADVSGDALFSPVMAKPAVAVVSVTSQRQRVQRQTLRQPSDDFWPVRNADLTRLAPSIDVAVRHLPE